MAKRFLDTNILLTDCSDISDCVVSSKSIEELENIKTSSYKDNDIKYKARQAVRAIKEQKPEIIVVQQIDYDKLNTLNLEITNDNLIISSAYRYSSDYDKNVVFVTNDILCGLIAEKYFGLNVRSICEKQPDDYKGYIDYYFSTDEEIAEFYGNMQNNTLGLMINQYAILYNPTGEIIDKVKWDGTCNKTISYKPISNDFVGKVKPRNVQQELCFDMLQDNKSTIKVIRGNFGTGKDFLMVTHAIQFIKQNKYDKLIWVRNNVEVKNTNPIGFLPNDMKSKLLPFALPLADHLGGESGLEMFINQGKIEIQHLGFIRGRNITNSIIYCSESENMTKEHIQLLIGRVAEGSTLWINGDNKQVDDKVFERNNGLSILVDKLKGNSKFATVMLQKTERSETAALADILD